MLLLIGLFLLNASILAENDWDKKITAQNMHTVSWEDDDWDVKGFCEFIEQAYAVQKNLQPFRLRKFSFEIVNRVAKDLPVPSLIIQDIQTWEDISLFHGRMQDDPYIGSLIDRSCTEFGKVTLLRMLLPTDDVALLQKRQTVIRFLAANPTILHDLRSSLMEIAQTQKLLLSFWINDPLANTVDEYYFNYGFFENLNDSLNHNYGVMCAKSLLKNQYRVGNFAMLVGAIVIPIAYYAWQQLGGERIETVDFLQEQCRDGANSLSFVASLVNNPRIKDAARFFAVGLCALEVKNTFDWVKGHFLLMTILQERMMHVRRFIDASFRLGALMQEYPELTELLAFANNVHSSFTLERATPEFLQLYGLLQSDTFEGIASVMSNHGKILSAFKLMQPAKEDLERIIAAVGEVDAFASLATLFEEHASGEARYCFAEFVRDTHPKIMMKDAWNPFLDRSHAVVNDVSFGGNVPNSGMITGPNAGGKSTIMKGIFIAIWCAQSLGIVPASQCILTPFSHLATYMSITDDIVAGKSLFKAEVARAHHILERIKEMESNCFSLIVMDEIFSGTNPKEGEAAAYSVAQHIGAFDNVICLIATHYPLMKVLADDIRFANYHVSVERQNDRLYYPYILQKGTSDQCIALDILQEDGFESDIVNTARTILNSCRG